MNKENIMAMIDDYVICEATPEDAGELLDIYSYYVENTAATFEVRPPTLTEFTGRIIGAQKKYPYLLITHDEEIMGFAFAHAFRERPAYDYAAEVTIYLRHDLRRRGYGKILYTALEEELKRMGVISLYACVALPSGEDEHLSMDSPVFHEALGYRRCAEFRNCGYKFGTWYTMVWMEKILCDFPDRPAPLTSYPDLMNQTAKNVPENLSVYDEQQVRLVTEYGEMFRGEATSFCAEYGMHEFGVEEEGIQIDSCIFYRHDIRSVEPV